MENFNPSNFTIFIADDNPENLTVLNSVLEEQGYNTRAARNGLEVIKSIDISTPDLLLLDIHMPKMDGYETCQQIRKKREFQNLPILFISALNESFNRIKGFEVGGNDYINKPFNTQEVLVRIKTHLLLKSRADRLEKALEDLKTYQAHLINSAKHNYLAKLVASVAHELNTPLGNSILAQSTISNALETIIKNKQCSDLKQFKEIKEYNDLCGKSLEIMRSISDRFKELGSQFESPFVQDNIYKTIQRLLPIFSQGTEEENPKVKITGDETLVWDINFQAFYQVIYSLIKNSFDHSGLKTSSLEITIDFHIQDQNLLLLYKDNGVGIPSSILEHVWDPFYTTKRSGEHLGLGLHLVYIIINKVFCGTTEITKPESGFEIKLTFPQQSERQNRLSEKRNRTS